MTGMDAVTGAPISGDAHLAQSVGDILNTPIGTRVMRRGYGSDLPDLVDAPVNALTRLRLFAATAVAIARWEPRLQLTRVGVAGADATGALALAIEGQRTDAGRATDPLRFTIPIRPAA